MIFDDKSAVFFVAAVLFLCLTFYFLADPREKMTDDYKHQLERAQIVIRSLRNKEPENEKITNWGHYKYQLM